ncbi:SDR family oxidoreductase [Patescibacteria group bacterium]|nr:SDR family oxidoreductase [Patescibacteria group bacterium]MBU4367261.1 SDR family oxidoreductase [Patescibacteria group bacterium]MBU4461510.1 SDR family oxidoreductase [Patescibacteria group bacterium]MCG2699952.1 SDR family oxidoreductase [Candidatus Parcubacteria bacterium]
MKCLITGGAGFIGGHLVDKLIEQNHKVVVIDNLSTGKKENLNPKADFYQLDICDFEKIQSLFGDIDYIFHLAAIPRVPISVEDPVGTSRVNILGTINVFKAAIDAGVKRIVFASSSSVYGDQEKLPLKESMVPNPLSPYALQKLAGEQFAKLFVRLYKVPIVCLRYFNVYGPRIDFDSDYSLVLGKFLRLRSQNKPLTIYDDGEQTRGFCYIDDIIEANIKAMESDKVGGGEIINIGSNKSHSINYLSKLIGGEVKYLPPRIGDVRHTQADITLAKNLFGWEPKIDFKDGIELTKQWFQKKYGKQ